MAKNNNIITVRLLPTISFMTLLLSSQLLPVITTSAALVVSPVLGNQLGTASAAHLQHEIKLQPAEEITTINGTTTSTRKVSGAPQRHAVANLEKRKISDDEEVVASDQKLKVHMKKKMWRPRPTAHRASARRITPISASVPTLLVLGSLIILSSFI